MKYELKHHGFVQQFGYDVWEILEDGISNGTLYPNKEAAQRDVDFYNVNNITKEEYKVLLRTKPRTALEMWKPGFYDKYESFFSKKEEQNEKEI